MVVVEPGPFATELFTTSPRPADLDGRIDRYPAIAHEAFENLMQSFEGMFNDPDTPTDPVMVVEQMVELIDTPAGSRPFRTVVGVDVGVRDRNAGRRAVRCGRTGSVRHDRIRHARWAS